jgi:hypothetical protein
MIKGMVCGVKRLSRKLIVRQMLQMLPRLSMDNIIRIIDLGERLLSREDHREVAESMKRYIRDGHPAVRVIERVLHELSIPNDFNLFVLALLSKTSFREELNATEGSRPINPTSPGEAFFGVQNPTWLGRILFYKAIKIQDGRSTISQYNCCFNFYNYTL